MFVLPAHVLFSLITCVLNFEFCLCYVLVSPTRLTIKIECYSLNPLPLFHLLILTSRFFFFFFHIITLIIFYKWLNWYLLLLLLFGLKDYILVAKGLIVELALPHAQNAWEFRGKRVWTARLASYCTKIVRLNRQTETGSETVHNIGWVKLEGHISSF